MEGHVPLRLGEPGETWGGPARAGIAVPEHLDVSAERDRAEFPTRPGAVPPAEHLGTKTDREDFDPHSVPARDQVVAELVNEDEHGKNDQERNDIAQAIVKEFDHSESVGAAERAELRRPERLAAVSRAVVSKL